ncbi:MAG: hypothetical protein RIB98_18580 [Acidimicrobiales bacterium]
MAIERQENSPQRQGLPLPARVALGAVAILAAITVVQWVIGALIAVVKVALVVVVAVAVAVWVVGAKSSR